MRVLYEYKGNLYDEQIKGTIEQGREKKDGVIYISLKKQNWICQILLVLCICIVSLFIFFTESSTCYVYAPEVIYATDDVIHFNYRNSERNTENITAYLTYNNKKITESYTLAPNASVGNIPFIKGIEFEKGSYLCKLVYRYESSFIVEESIDVLLVCK